MPELDVNSGIVTKYSTHPVPETLQRLLTLLQSKNMKVFAVIDQRDEALRAGLNLRETTLVLFGNPTAGTPVMDAVPLAALDLPLKILVWAHGDQVAVSYVSPSTLVGRYTLSADLEANISGIDALTDALVAQ